MSSNTACQPRHISDLKLTQDGTPELGLDQFISRLVYLAAVAVDRLFTKARTD